MSYWMGKLFVQYRPRVFFFFGDQGGIESASDYGGFTCFAQKRRRHSNTKTKGKVVFEARK